MPPLPPPWYPPMYPTPYVGVDPLHFFIDLRVSGHIYDRKRAQKHCEDTDSSSGTLPVPSQFQSHPDRSQNNLLGTLPSAENSFKSSGHSSAFAVPCSLGRNVPMNLSTNEGDTETVAKSMKYVTKFDVKSLGLEKCSNKIGKSFLPIILFFK